MRGETRISTPTREAAPIADGQGENAPMRRQSTRAAFLAAATLALLSQAVYAQDKKDEKKDKPAAPAPAATPAPAPSDEVAKLKASLATLEKENAALKAEVAGFKLKMLAADFEKIGARVTTEKPKEGPEVTTVNILKLYNGDKDSLAKLKDLPNLQVIYVDNGQFNDAGVAALKDLVALNSLTLMSPLVTDAALDSLKGLVNLNMLFLTNTKVGDAGLDKLKPLKNLKVLALSRTQVTDKGLDTLKEIKGLKSVYLIGTKVTDDGVKKFKAALPEVAVYK